MYQSIRLEMLAVFDSMYRVVPAAADASAAGRVPLHGRLVLSGAPSDAMPSRQGSWRVLPAVVAALAMLAVAHAARAAAGASSGACPMPIQVRQGGVCPRGARSGFVARELIGLGVALVAEADRQVQIYGLEPARP